VALGLLCKQRDYEVVEVLHFHQYAIPELLYLKLAHLYGKRTSRVNDFVAQTYA